MGVSVSKKVLSRNPTNPINHVSNIHRSSVRRNASSSMPVEGSISSDASSTISLSKQDALQQKKTEKVAKVSSLLREYGFTDAHISKLEKEDPGLFLEYNPQKILCPILKFLESSIGLSKADIPKFVMQNNYFLKSSLEKKLIPCHNYLKNLPVCENELKKMVKSQPRILTMRMENSIAPNLELLRGMEVHVSIITYFLTHHHFLRALCWNHDLFKASVDKAIEMGFNPSTKMFVIAVYALCFISNQNWDLKMEIFRGFGLLDAEILLVFKKQPCVMIISEEKLARGLEFFLKELNWTPATLASDPVVLHLSLERRVIPRTQVMEILREKGLADISATQHFYKLGEEKFLKQYIHRYMDILPELMDIYKGYSSSQRKTSK